MYVRHLFQDYASISFVGKKQSVNIFDMVLFHVIATTNIWFCHELFDSNKTNLSNCICWSREQRHLMALSFRFNFIYFYTETLNRVGGVMVSVNSVVYFCIFYFNISILFFIGMVI